MKFFIATYLWSLFTIFLKSQFVCYLFLSSWGVAGLTGEGQGTPWMSRQLIAGPLLMAVAAPQGANCTSGAILGFSILLKDTSACSSVPPQGSRGLEPATFRSLVHQLYPLSYSRPWLDFFYNLSRTLKSFRRRELSPKKHQPWIVLLHSAITPSNSEMDRDKKIYIYMEKQLTGGWSPPSSLSRLPLELLESGF